MKKIMSIVCVLAMLLMSFSSCGEDESISNGDKIEKDDITIRLKIGWCLGSALDNIDYHRSGSCEYYETLWGNPVTTKQMIDKVKNAGFQSVRIPVTWYDHTDENGNIDPEWMSRVEEIVNYVLDDDMTCIINLHHDTGETAWIKANMDKKDEMERIVRKLWSQIAAHFANYNDRLLFESLNEILNEQNNWTGASQDDYAITNDLNQVFVDTVRKSGGNNAERYLIVNTYAASTEQDALDAFVMPTDSAENRLIAEVHYYETSENAVSNMIKRVKKRFVDKGIPVIIGEFGMKANTEGDENGEARRKYAEYLVKKASEEGIGCFWWDSGGSFASAEDVNNYALLNRSSLEWYDDELVNIIVSSAKVK